MLQMIGIFFRMELLYSVFFICVLSNVLCQDCSKYPAKGTDYGKVTLKQYEVYIMGFLMVIMFITIICLSIALYMVRHNKTIYGININKKTIYVRQESAQGVTVRSYGNTVHDLCRNDGSTLTVNSGIVEVSGPIEPETPTRIELKDEKKTSCIKKPIMLTIPTMQKAQMDDIIKQVLLNKRTERGSTTLRELDAFTNQKTANENENYAIKDTSTSSCYSDTITKENDHDESLYENLPTKQINQSNAHVKNQQARTYPVTEEDGVDGFETHIKVEDEHEVYDRVPNPVRCIDGNLDDGYIENLPVYDCPPRRSMEKEECSSAVLDPDTNYLLLLSTKRDDDKTSYINARSHNTS